MESNDSHLLHSLSHQPGVQDAYLSKRSEPRHDLATKMPLDIRRESGHINYASAISVSNSGIGFMCRTLLEHSERIGIRISSAGKEFEEFEVHRVTPTVGGYKIGAIKTET